MPSFFACQAWRKSTRCKSSTGELSAEGNCAVVKRGGDEDGAKVRLDEQKSDIRPVRLGKMGMDSDAR